MGAVEDPLVISWPATLKDDAQQAWPIEDIRKGDDCDSIRCQLCRSVPQGGPRIYEMLQDIGSDETVKRLARKRLCQHIPDIPDHNMIQPRTSDVSGVWIQLNTDDLGPVASLQDRSERTNRAAEVKDASRRIGYQSLNIRSLTRVTMSLDHRPIMVVVREAP